MNQGKWFGLVVLILLTACGRAHAPLSAAPPTGMPRLAPPSEMARGVAIADAEQVRFGTEFSPQFATSNVVPDVRYPDAAIFKPTASPFNPAWAVYGFNLSGYDEAPTLHFHWDTDPAGQSVWLALSNWDGDRWDFVAFDPTSVDLGDISKYIAPTGKFLLALIAVDSTNHELRWLSVGDAPAPGNPRVYDVYPRSSQPDTDLTLHANVSGTTPVTYAWDFGGGADPNTSSDPQPTVHIGALGDYAAKLTLSNKYGSYEFDFVLHSVVPSWTSHIIGDALNNKFVTCDTSWKDHSLVAAEMADGRVTVFEFDDQGNLEWNRAYTGLPANHVTSILYARPDYISSELDTREFYFCCYQDDGSGPGNAYVVGCAADGSVSWYLPLGQGKPDLSWIDDNFVAVSLAEPNGQSVIGRLGSNGAVIWAKETVDPANYYCCAGAEGTEGIYVAGTVGGKSTLAHVSFDGDPLWTNQYPGNGVIADCAFGPGMGAVIYGKLPLKPDQIIDSFFMTVRNDGLQLAHEQFRSGDCLPVSIVSSDGLLYLTASSIIGTDSQVYAMDPSGSILKALRIEGPGQVFGAANRFTRRRPPTPIPPVPPEQPAEQLIFVAAANSPDITVSQFSVTTTEWRPVETVLPGDLQDYTLPQETLSIVPEAVTYTVDQPAGGLDGLFVRVKDAY